MPGLGPQTDGVSPRAPSLHQLAHRMLVAKLRDYHCPCRDP